MSDTAILGGGTGRGPRSGRVAAVGLLLVVAIGAVLLVVLPLEAAKGRYRDSIETLSDRLVRLQRAESQRAVLERRLAKLEDRQLGSKALFREESVTIAGARLQETTRKIIVDSHGDLQSIELREFTEEGSLVRIALRVQFGGGMETLQETLHRLEWHEPWILVDELTVQVGGGQTTKADRDASLPIELKIVLELSAYRQIKEDT